MFPLGTVLLPGGILPLHVFEPRYREMIADCLAAETEYPEFGVVLIERGSATGGGDQRAMVATLARVVEVATLEDGRYVLVTVGMERLRVSAWLPDDPYPIADVEPWPEVPLTTVEIDDSGLAAQIDELDRQAADLLTMAQELGDLPRELVHPVARFDPGQALYDIASKAPIGPADRYRILCAGDSFERLEVLTAAMEDVAAMLRFRTA